jgi:hypothetical protein
MNQASVASQPAVLRCGQNTLAVSSLGVGVFIAPQPVA